MNKRYFILAGETSGDMHAAALIEQIKMREPDAHFAGLGGDKMQAAGCMLYQHIQHMAFMGFVAVIQHWKEIRSNFRIAHEAIVKEQPDVLILIDYPSFNLRIASFCKKQLPHIKIVYYIPPKVWAWKKRRIHTIARLCDEVLGIFPFEPAFYQHYAYPCTYVGNPTAERISALEHAGKRTIEHAMENTKEPYIALLPGSRESEIRHCLPRMIAAAQRYPDYRLVICASPGISDDYYTPYLSGTRATLTRDTYGAIQCAQAAIVNSGTATLETALLRCPQVAVYHLACSQLIGVLRWAQPLLFTIPYFTLVNIIAGKEVIKECIANDFTVDKVSAELDLLLHNDAHKKEMLKSYEHLFTLLGSQRASVQAAGIITSIPLTKPGYTA